MRFHNQLAVVTGAAQGIGAAVVQQLLAQGARVALLDRNEQQLRDFYQTLNSDVCSMYVVDVADAQAVERCIEQVENTQGVIGLLANVAGILHLDSLLDGSMSHWLDTFSVNTHGVFYVSRAVGRRMQARGEGAIVTVASNASNTPRLNMGAYAASKAASTQLTLCLGLELARAGVRCNVVSPARRKRTCSGNCGTHHRPKTRCCKVRWSSFAWGFHCSASHSRRMWRRPCVSFCPTRPNTSPCTICAWMAVRRFKQNRM